MRRRRDVLADADVTAPGVPDAVSGQTNNVLNIVAGGTFYVCFRPQFRIVQISRFAKE